MTSPISSRVPEGVSTSLNPDNTTRQFEVNSVVGNHRIGDDRSAPRGCGDPIWIPLVKTALVETVDLFHGLQRVALAERQRRTPLQITSLCKHLWYGKGKYWYTPATQNGYTVTWAYCWHKIVHRD